MISPPTDRLHKFLAIAGTALFILGVTIPLDRYDQSKRQCIEATAKRDEIEARQRSSPASGVDQARLGIEKARLRKQHDLAQHAEQLYAIWLVLGCICIFGGMVLAALGFAMWWRQPEGER